MFLPLFDKDHAHWALLHGLRVFEIEGTNQFRVLLDKKCEQLGDDNLCKIYENRPQMCREFDCNNLPKYKEIIL